MPGRRPVALVVMDGWGAREDSRYNAVALARTPSFNRLRRDFPNTQLLTSGEAVGLPAGQMGNSEVGHLNLGAGRVVYQDLVRVDRSVSSGEFFRIPAFVDLMRAVRARGTALHLVGLVSDGGVHSHQRHLWALLELARREGLERVHVHAILDGRDTPPESGAGFVGELLAQMRRVGVGDVASVGGRYYAMDRDQRWERVKRAFDAIAQGEGPRAADPVQAVRDSYAAGKTDEFVLPVVIGAEAPVGPMRPGDGVIFFNFRADRAREICQALADPAFQGFPRTLPGVELVTLARYRADFPFPVAFDSERLVQILADVWAEHGLTNLRIAETEKYAHVTYFFNGGQEPPFPGEERVLIPSPKVATYDLQPEMSAPELTRRLLELIASRKFDALVVNYANPDMVGHTGVLEAAIRAVETVDSGIGPVVDAILAQGGAAMVTADHGNCEQMWDDTTGGPHTAHSTNPVPFILADAAGRPPLRAGGILADVAPTFLGLMGLPVPAEMTGKDLRVRG
ncbi:MAG TPA: 2,3-bisphosphoglycerate-independent phosphoglycerate mutase [Candidatus Saccharimonadales bacterium]|nr:2,3-bisphosphoglycerate-independent phosphoglycerate mutase [Candidatus Saccharimonadales bacterium]